jgi:sugar phosphate isomerase/epimerase
MQRYGTSTSVIWYLPRDEALETIAAAGFSEIELGGGEGYFDHWDIRPTGEMARAVARAGLRVRVLHIPGRGSPIAHVDDGRYIGAIDAVSACLGQAAALGAETVVCHPDFRPPPDCPPDQHRTLWTRSHDALAALAERADRAGVALAVEPGTVDVAAVLSLIEGLGAHVGICLDTGHVNAIGCDPAHEARVAGERLLCLHINDNDGRGQDQHLVPGEGTIDWDALVDTIDAMDFRGARNFEVAGLPERDPRPIVRQLARLAEGWEARQHPRKD